MDTIEIGFCPAIFDGSPALHSFLVLKKDGEVVDVAGGSFSSRADGLGMPHAGGLALVPANGNSTQFQIKKLAA